MPSLFRFLMFLGLIGGLAYGAVFSLANFVTYQPREIIVTIPPDKFAQAAALTGTAAWPGRKASDETLIELFLDMLAAERGAGANTLAAYRNDLDDLAAYLRAARQHDRRARRPTICAAFSADLTERGFKAVVAGAAAFGDAPALSLPLRRRKSRATIRPPCWKGPKRGRALPKVLSIADVDRAADAGARQARRRGAAARARGCARRGCCACSKCVYATGLRVSELVALPASAARRDQRMLVVRGKGGKERLVPLNEAAKQRDGATISRCATKPDRDGRQSQMAVPVLRRAAATSRASISPAS